MSNLRICCFALMAVPCALFAQGGLPGTNVSAMVRFRSVTVVGDTTTVALSVAVNSASVEHLAGIAIKSSADGRIVHSPGSGWWVFSVYDSIPGASWWNQSPTAPGDSTPTLTFSARGVPGLSTVYLRGDSDITVPDSVYVPAYDPLEDLSRHVIGIGVEAVSTDPIVLATRLQTLSDSACALGWITSSTLCSTLHANSASDASSLITQFGASLDSAHAAGSAVNDAAYWLLKPNASYVLAHVPPPALSVYITGDTATSRYTAHPSGGVPGYSYYWEWCASECGSGGGDALRAPQRLSGGGGRPKTVAHGWNDVLYDGATVCWTMSESTLRVTVTDAVDTQVVAYYFVPLLEHTCGGW
jgi:hypothetical protein